MMMTIIIRRTKRRRRTRRVAKTKSKVAFINVYNIHVVNNMRDKRKQQARYTRRD